MLVALLLLPAVAAADSGGPLTMWLAEGAGNRVYVLGSIHLLRQQDHPLPAAIDDAYEEAEILYMELDMDDLDPLALQATVNRLGVIDDDRTLADLMGAGLYEQAEAAAAEIDIPLDLLSKSEPWLAAITVEQMTLARIGFNPAFGIEMHYSSRAIADGKEILGFESFEEQIGFLDGLSIEAQRELLVQTLSEGAGLRDLMDEVIAAWRRGDVRYLEESLLDEIEQYPELNETLVAARNRRWVEVIEALLDEQDDYLVIVGALHLVGETGVPALLDAKGIRIVQVGAID